MAQKPMSIEQSARMVLDILANHGPRGYESPFLSNKDPANTAGWNGHLYLKWNLPGWGVNADITVRWGRTSEDIYEPTVSVSWSSTHYGPGAAVAAAKLHADVAAFACLVEHALRAHTNIITEATENLPKEK